MAYEGGSFELPAPINQAANDGFGPDFRLDHRYRFVIDLGDYAGTLTLGYGDGGAFNNSGSYHITLYQVELNPGPRSNVDGKLLFVDRRHVLHYWVEIDEANSSYAVKAQRSANGGKTWGAPTTVLQLTGDDFDRYEISKFDGVYAVPKDRGRLVATFAISDGLNGSALLASVASDDFGASWDTSWTVATTVNTGASFVGCPIINTYVEKKGDVHLHTVIASGGAAHAYVASSYDGGRTWSSTKLAEVPSRCE